LNIEKNIPIPSGHATGYTATAKRMEIGDSVLFETKQEAISLRLALYKQKKGGLIREAEKGWRIWCVVKS